MKKSRFYCFLPFFAKILIFLFTAFSLPYTINSQTWAPIGGGMGGFVTCITTYNGEMIAGGSFISAGGVPANRIAKWNGTTWNPLGSGVSGSQNFVQALEVYNGNLWVGGNFTTAGGLPATYLCRWNGSAWFPLPVGTNAGVYDFQIYNNELVICGNFITCGGTAANYIIKWNGAAGLFSTLGSGMDQPSVYACSL
jgi:hypothetical protein